jgi:hypothetical protein
MRIIGPVEQGGPLMLPICRNGMQGQPPVRAKADFAHELRVRCHLGDVTREECDRPESEYWRRAAAGKMGR